MPSSVRMNGNATPNETYAIGATVALSNFDNTGVVSWAWTLLSKPAGSTATLATPTASTSSFVADKEGSYRIRLVTNDGTSFAVARVKTTHVSLIPFAKDETSEGDATEGWAKGWRESYQLIDQRLGIPANRRTVRYGGSAASGPLVLTPTGAVATLPNGDIVPVVDRLSAGFGRAAAFLWEGGALSTNQDIRVLAWGMSDLFANPDTMVADNPVYLGTNGVLRKTLPGGDSVQEVGYCLLVDGGNVRVWFEPRSRVNNSTAPAAVSIDAVGAANGTSRQFAPADHVHRLNTYGSTPAAVGTASAGTVGVAPARGDHVHAHGTQLGGTLHAEASVSVNGAGFMAIADKDKVNQVGDDNMLMNGGFYFWDRGLFHTYAATQSVIDYYDYSWNTSYASPYMADRWYLQVKKTASGSASFSVSADVTDTAFAPGTSESRNGLRIRNGTASLANHVYQVAQEMYDNVRKMVGKPLAWSLKALRGSAVPSDANLVIEIWTSEDVGGLRFRDYSVGATLLFSTQISGGTLTTSAQEISGLTAVVPTNVTNIAFVIGFEQNGSGPGTVNDFIAVTDVIVSPTESATLGRVPRYRFDFVKEESECRHYFQKSTVSLYTDGPPNHVNGVFTFTPYTGHATHPYASVRLKSPLRRYGGVGAQVKIYADDVWDRVYDVQAAAYLPIASVTASLDELEVFRFTTTGTPAAAGNPIGFNWMVEAEII